MQTNAVSLRCPVLLQEERKRHALYLNPVTFANTRRPAWCGCRGRGERPRAMGRKREPAQVSLVLARWRVCKAAVCVVRLSGGVCNMCFQASLFSHLKSEQNNGTSTNRGKDETRTSGCSAQHSASHTVSTQERRGARTSRSGSSMCCTVAGCGPGPGKGNKVLLENSRAHSSRRHRRSLLCSSNSVDRLLKKFAV